MQHLKRSLQVVSKPGCGRTSVLNPPPGISRQSVLKCSLVSLCVIGLVGADSAGVTSAAEVDYTRDVKPLLAKKCTACHGPLSQEGGLRLDAAVLIRQGSDSGAVVDLKQPQESLLLQRVTASDPADRMPPEGEGEPLTAGQRAILQNWIQGGLKAPENEDYVKSPRDHWAYQVPERPELPSGVDADWSRHPIDRLIGAQHAAAGVRPVRLADRATLLRRVCLDVTGLPPSRELLHSFLQDEHPEAWERVVDQLLNSPAYGERWGRHWMDVWRYSDWDGYRNELRGSQRHIWRWRDWIVESLNEDRPYDQMVHEMLAADELVPGDEHALRATGFLARHYYKFNRHMWLDNTVEHTFKAFMGVTINCAKCHDHKYDPIQHAEYYAARAIFEPYQVRIDRLPGEADTQKAGLTRVYDANPEALTYVFLQGNDKRPDKENPVSPAVPSVFGTQLEIEPVKLPVESFYPAVQEFYAREARQQAAAELAATEKRHQQAVNNVTAAKKRLAQLQNQQPPTKPDEPPQDQASVLVADTFEKLDQGRWEVVGGKWQVVDGHVTQQLVSRDTAALVLKQPSPQDFEAEFEFQITGDGMYHSVGLAFDWQGPNDRDGVYLSAHAPGPKVQIVHQRGGQATYPTNGRLSLPIKLQEKQTLRVAVRDRLLNVTVNGQLAVAYQLPHSRREGRVALWVFDSQAELHGFRLSALPSGRQLATTVDGKAAPVQTMEGAEVALKQAERAEKLAKFELQSAEFNQRVIDARIQADRSRFSPGASSASEAADKAAATAARFEAEQAEKRAELARMKAEDAVQTATENGQPAAKVKELQTKLSEAEKKLKEARASVAKAADAKYTALGTEYPRQSTGRRLALARWLTDRQNPLTARVAVNHIWLRHFGQPLVSGVFDLGLRTEAGPHQALLDWLAVELMDNGWRMKSLHRLILTSRAYQLASTAADDPRAGELNQQRDPENTLYWRYNVQRLNAEVIRDSVLAASGSLDRTLGGPDIDYAEGEKTPRRSLYFRHAYEKQMQFLLVFDAASPNECYRRSTSIIPQQALALSNSQLALSEARKLAASLSEQHALNAAGDRAFVEAAFEIILSRAPTSAELDACRVFLDRQAQLLADGSQLTPFGASQAAVKASDNPHQRSRENLVHVLFNHNDFVTVR